MPGLKAVVEEASQVCLERIFLEHVGTLPGGQLVGVGRGCPVMRRRLAMGALPGRADRRDPPVPQDSGGVPRVPRVMDEAGWVDPVDADQNA
jgi:hypothetical protein